MDEWKNPNEMSVSKLIKILQEFEPDAVVINGNEENIRIYLGMENKKNGRKIIMIC